MSGQSRRKFLKFVAQTSFASPILSRLFSIDHLLAQDAASEKRFVSIFTPHGTDRERWLPRVSGGGYHQNNFTLQFTNSILGSLESQKNYLTLIDGLYHPSRTGHEDSAVACLSGARRAGEFPLAADIAKGSIDTFIGKAKAGPGHLHDYLLFGVDGADTGIMGRMHYEPGGTIVTPLNDPIAMYDKIFGSFTPSASGSHGDPNLAKRLYVEQGVKALEQMRSFISSDSKKVLESHLEALEGIAKQFKDLSLSCTIPAPLTLEDIPGFPAPENQTQPATKLGCYQETYYCRDKMFSAVSQNLPVCSRLQIDLLVEALYCRITPSASLTFGHAGYSASTYGFAGVNREMHNDLAHNWDTNAAYRAEFTAMHQWWTGEVKYLLQKMSQKVEGSSTLLGNVLGLWTNEFGNAREHSATDLPIIVFGGNNGFKKGWFRYPDTAFNKLLVSISKSFGIETETFGDPTSAGELPNLRV